MLRSPWEWVLIAIVVGGPLGLMVRKAVGDRVFLLAWFHLVYGSIYVVLVPDGDPWAAAMAALGLIGFDLALGPDRPSVSLRVLRGARTRSGMAAMALLAITLVSIAAIEVACRGLTNRHVLGYHLPIETVWKAGADDWRAATIMADELREPDPVLLWRPVARKPYTSQRFKGPLLQSPRPDGVIRIMCYGDSLTDGPPKGDWPGRLHRLLEQETPRTGLRFEVANAGVTGYSSHQGLLRFLQEVDRYQPDLLLISFGWNDVAQAEGKPDRGFRPPSWPVVGLQRALIRYRAYLVLTFYMRKLHGAPAADAVSPYNPRVSIEEYLSNLDRFRAEAEARDIPIVFLTRPHLASQSALRQTQTWRRHVPEYNAALVSWARIKNLAMIDVQAFFEQQPASLFSDECHFFASGYQRMAELVKDRLFIGPDALMSFNAQRPAIVRKVAEGRVRVRSRPMERTAFSVRKRGT